GHVSAFYPAFSEGTLVRVHFIIGRAGGETPDPDQATLEAAVEEIVTDWQDDLVRAIRDEFEPAAADQEATAWRGAFPAGYREATSPRGAVADIRTVLELTPEHPIAGVFHREAPESDASVGLKL